MFCREVIGGFAPLINTVQNTQASPEFLALPQVIPTSTPIPKPISKMHHIIANLRIAKFIAILDLQYKFCNYSLPFNINREMGVAPPPYRFWHVQRGVARASWQEIP